VLDNREAESGTAGRAGAVGPVEALEEAREVVVVHAGPVVDGGENGGIGVCVNGEPARRAGARVADRVLREVRCDDANHARPHGELDVVSLDDERNAGALGGVSEAVGDLLEQAERGRRPEGHDLAAGLELAEEENVVDELADLSHLGVRLLDEFLHVRVGKEGRLEERQEPREGRPQLVRDGGREAGAELLVRAEVAGVPNVEKRLRLPVHLVGDRDRTPAAQEVRRQRVAFADSLERLARAAARDENAPLLVQHEDDLAALLDEHPASLGVELELRGATPLLAPLHEKALHTARSV
jgi:hypothetical protein